LKDTYGRIVSLTGWLAIAAILTWAAAGTAWAADFNTLDRNRDGCLDMKELDPPAAELFRTYDRNKDGVLDAEEFRQIKGARSRFEELDLDRNGRIDLEELRQAASRRFQACDANGDGRLDAKEIRACGSGRPPGGGSQTAAEGEKRVDLFDRHQQDRTLTKALQGGDEERKIPTSPRYQPTISPVFSIFF